MMLPIKTKQDVQSDELADSQTKDTVESTKTVIEGTQTQASQESNINLNQISNGFRHTKGDRNKIVKGNQYRIKSATAIVQKNHLIYIGRLEKETTEDAVRAHIADVGLSNKSVADDIKLKCRSEHESSFCLSVSSEKSKSVLFDPENWLSGARIRQFKPAHPRKRFTGTSGSELPPRFRNRNRNFISKPVLVSGNRKSAAHYHYDPALSHRDEWPTIQESFYRPRPRRNFTEYGGGYDRVEREYGYNNDDDYWSYDEIKKPRISFGYSLCC